MEPFSQKQLLCTFATLPVLEKTIGGIQNYYKILDGRIFVFYNEKCKDELYLTYITEKSQTSNKFPNTITIHRKKQTGTLYSLNSMNVLIKEENGGVFDKTFQLEWELYKNCLILTGEISVRIIPIALKEIRNVF